MIVTGLEHSAYYFYNPIIVRVTDLNQKLNLNISLAGQNFDFTLTPFNNEVVFDLSEILRGIAPKLSNKKSIQYNGTSWVVDGSYQAILNFSNEIILNKVFVRGGKIEHDNNISVNSSRLSVSVNKWSNYPSFSFSLNGNQITGSPLLDVNRYERIKCTDAYIIFRNNLGGFDFYLFEDFDISENPNSKGFYVTMNNIVDSGKEPSKTISLRTKLKREDVDSIMSLVNSNEIYLYEAGNKLTRLVGGQSTKITPKKYVQDFTVTFNVPLNYSQL